MPSLEDFTTGLAVRSRLHPDNRVGRVVMDRYAAYVGWDWADEENEVSLRVRDHSKIERMKIGGTPGDLHQWACQMLERFEGEKIAVAIDAGRGAVISAFLGYPHLVLYPINPKSAADLRHALYPSHKKDDRIDSEILEEIVEKHGDRLRPLMPADEKTRELGMLCEHRKKLDNDRKREVNRLRDTLKSFYPQALEMFEEMSTPVALEFLQKWSSFETLRRARSQTLIDFFHTHGSRAEEKIQRRLEVIRSSIPLTSDGALLRAGALRVRTLVVVLRSIIDAVTILDDAIAELYDEHPEHDLVDSFPGLGPVLGPRVVTVLTTDRNRFESAEALQRMTGIAPVTSQTGGRHGSLLVTRRVRCPKFIHQTFVEWAGCSITRSAWASAYFEMHRERNPKRARYSILRALAFKWQRILYQCWVDRVPYDEQKYLRELAKRGSPIAKRLGLTLAA